MKKIIKSDQSLSTIKVIEPNYDGIAKVLSNLAHLYKAGADKDILDKILLGLIPKLQVLNNEAKNGTRE